jgi:TPP-dependent 2-oxoacid decarboxylase
LYADIIAFRELLVNHPKSSTKVVLSRNHEINISANTQEKIMLAKLLERLAEMFPESDYQSRLERYIASHHPQNAGDIEHLQRQYDQAQYDRGLV